MNEIATPTPVQEDPKTPDQLADQAFADGKWDNIAPRPAGSGEGMHGVPEDLGKFAAEAAQVVDKHGEAFLDARAADRGETPQPQQHGRIYSLLHRHHA